MAVCVYPRVVPRKLCDAATALFARSPIMLTKQYGVSSEMSEHRGLPEFLFLGSTNAGKSSVLSSLLSPKKAKFRSRLPLASGRPGFTKTISAWRVGTKLRLLDSPGYGFKSRSEQGLLVSQYLEKFASNVVKTYVLVPAQKGISGGELGVIRLLSQYGVPFTFVFTKCDLVKDRDIESWFKESCEAANECGAIPPGEAFAVSTAGKGSGIKQLRGDIYASSGLLEIEELGSK